MKKNSYHTNTKLAHFFGILDEEIAAQIPVSTLNGWNNLNVSNIFGLDYACNKYNKKIDTLKVLKAKLFCLLIVQYF